MKRLILEGFSIDLPPGWSPLAVDATYSDPTEGERRLFGRPGSPAALFVGLLPIDHDTAPTDEREHVRELAGGWGRARGLAAPLTLTLSERPDGTLAWAEYKLALDYVAVWFLSNSHEILHASYVTSWHARDDDRAAREAIVASLTFWTGARLGWA